MKKVVSATVRLIAILPKLSLFYLLYFRIRLLKLIRFIKDNIGNFPQNVESTIKNIINGYKYQGSIFSWNNSHLAIKGRLLFLVFIFSSGFMLVGIKLILVAGRDYINSKHYHYNSNKTRHDIVDRNGNLLAVSLPSASLYANPKKVVAPLEQVKKLKTILPKIDSKKILSLLNSDKSFVWIKRDITPKQQQDIHNLGLPGFEFEREQKRIYTYGNLLSHVIGYVGRDMNGLAGIEKYFDDTLNGNNIINTVSTTDSSLQLSIDVAVQNILSEEIDKVIKKFKADGASGIVVDPNNGEVIAMVSKPDFDPHYPGRTKASQLFNMATQGVYEVGSGMKALTVAISLDTEATSMRDVYDLSYMKVGKFQIKDTHPHKGWHTVPEIFLNSSNIGVSQIMLETGKHNLRKYLKTLGLLDSLKIELPERGRPLFPPFSRWSDLSLVTMSYGYGISQSPAHFMQAMIPIINGGIMYPLTLVKNNKNAEYPRVFSEKTSNSIRQLLYLTVKEGTGKKAAVKDYYVGGKTGTAYKAIAGKYDKSKRISSFFAIIPASNPKYMIYIVIDDPKGIKETFGFAGGGWTAAPVVAKVLERMAILYGMEKPDKNSRQVQDLINIEYKIKDET